MAYLYRNIELKRGGGLIIYVHHGLIICMFIVPGKCILGVQKCAYTRVGRSYKQSIFVYANYQELMSAAKRREGAFNCAYRAVTASSKVIRHSMSILGLSVCCHT